MSKTPEKTLYDEFAMAIAPTLLKWTLELADDGKISSEEALKRAAEASYGFAVLMMSTRGGDRD